MQTKSFTQTMSDGFEIFINRWAPDSDDDIKGVIQLHHGLSEHSMRYDRLGSVLAENGYVLNAYDMRGHGRTAENAVAKKNGMFGKLADKDGFNRVVKDLYEVTNAVKNVYPGKKIVLLGHSFGSFVSQAYIEQFGDQIDGVILSGTAGPRRPLIFFGKIAAKIVRAVKGNDYVSPLLDKLSFGSYNKRIKDPKSKYSWLAANEMSVSMYEMDNWCGIPLTTSFFCDMLDGLSTIHKSSNMKKIPEDLPVFFFYGDQDPVGDYGKTINNLFDIYKKNGLQRLELKAFEGDRHEILNELDCEVVEKDIIDFISSI